MMSSLRILLGLWLLWFVALEASLLIDARIFDDRPPLKLTLRLTSSVLLVVAGVVAALATRPPWRGVAWLIALGMALGFVGDSTMAEVFGYQLFPNRVLGGMVFFGLGHVSYCLATDLARRRLRLPAGGRWWLAILAWQLIGLAIWYGVVYISGKKVDLHYPALGYCCLLAATAGLMTGLALMKPHFWLAAVGAALFLASDGFLAWQLFRGDAPLVSFLVWATYGPGQMLIVFGFAYALRREAAAEPGTASHLPT